MNGLNLRLSALRPLGNGSGGGGSGQTGPNVGSGMDMPPMRINMPSQAHLGHDFNRYVDPSGKAVLHSQGVDFSGGKSYKISLADMTVLEEVGRGQYGVVSRVFHKPTSVEMAMKQIRLEISDAAFRQILMELDVLHKSHSPYIVEFYGAFFSESAVYLCMEYMDAGSLDKLYMPERGLEEGVLARVAEAVIRGLQVLKEELDVIHRDVKPTNILVNLQGQVKLCDFGVSGQLVQSLAKTFIGCQSYMAPERIFPIMSQPNEPAYRSSSDVWSLGMSLYEAATGSYPFPPAIYDSVFAQLNAIVNETPPDLPTDRFSRDCILFINGCLKRNPGERLTYQQMLKSEFLEGWRGREVDMCGWARKAHEEWQMLKQTQSQSKDMEKLQQ